MSKTNEKSYLYITTYLASPRDSLSWALVLAPSAETEWSAKPSTLFCIAGQALGSAHCHQRQIHSPKDGNIVARMLIGLVHFVHKERLEQIIVHPRHCAGNKGSSLGWAYAVVNAVVESGCLSPIAEPIRIDVEDVVRQLTRFSEEVQRGKEHGKLYIEVPSIAYTALSGTDWRPTDVRVRT